MGQIRIEFAAFGGGRGTLGAQIDAPAEKPLASVTLTTAATATAAGAQPVVPGAGASAVFATLTALDVPAYVDLGASPNPAAEPRLLVVPGRAYRVQAIPGDKVSVLLASDVSGTVNVSGSVTVSGNSALVVGSLVRPANTTAYAAGQLVGNSTVAASVVPLQFAVARFNGGTGRLSRLRLTKSGMSITNAAFRVHLYRATPTCQNGDGAAWLTTESTYVGAFDVTMDRVFSDRAKGIGVPNVGSYMTFDTASDSTLLYGLIEARAAYAPVSGETFTAALEADRD